MTYLHVSFRQTPAPGNRVKLFSIMLLLKRNTGHMICSLKNVCLTHMNLLVEEYMPNPYKQLQLLYGATRY